MFSKALSTHENGVMMTQLATRYVSQGLYSKESFDRLEDINEKPTVATVGLSKSSDSAESLDGLHDTPILTHTPNLYKQSGVFVQTDGFIRLPRMLLESESWKSLRMRQQKLFLYILYKAQHSPFTFKYNGKDINLMPGDLCISLRRLVDDFNGSVKFKEEKIGLPFVQRAVSAFLKMGLTDTRTDTGISIISVIFPGIYDSSKSQTDTETDTGSIHLRYTNEERKEGKEIKETINDVRSPLSYEGKKTEKEKSYTPSVSDPEELEDPKISEEQIREDVLFALDFVKDSKIPLKDTDVERWIRKWQGFTVMANLHLMTRQKKTVIKPAAWMERALKEDWAKLKNNEPINRKFAEEFKKINNWSELKILQKYCTIEGASYDIMLNFDPETFSALLQSKHENLCRSHSGKEDY